MPFPSTEQLSRRKKMRHETPDCRLAGADRCPAAQIPVGIFLVSIENASFRRQAQKLRVERRAATGRALPLPAVKKSYITVITYITSFDGGACRL